MASGKQLKEDGIDRVLEGKEMWLARATGLYREYMGKHPQGFTAEACRVHALGRGLAHPHHPNAWGGLWSRIARTRAIEKTGHHEKARHPTNHACEIPVWRITELF